MSADRIAYADYPVDSDSCKGDASNYDEEDYLKRRRRSSGDS